MSLLVQVAEPTRQDRLKAWLVAHRVPQSEIAKRLGVTKQYLGKLLKREAIPTDRHSQLKALGLPESLLPCPVSTFPGRRPDPRAQGFTLP